MFSAASLWRRVAWLRRSSSLRLALLLALVFALSMAAAISVALFVGRDAVLARVDVTLEGIAASLEVDEAPGDGFGVIIRPLDEVQGLPRPFRRIVNDGGGTVILSNDFRGSNAWRVLIADDRDDEPVLIAVPIEDSEEALELLSGVLWTTASLLVLFTLGAGLVAGLLAQRRMTVINTTLDRLAAGDLQARTGSTRSRDDLDDLAKRLDVTAEELDRLVQQTRHLSASLAHDLRTPLARLRARLEMLPDGTARSDALEEALRLSTIFDTIMRVARIEAAQGTVGFQPVALKAFLHDLEDVFGPVVEDAGKRLRVEARAAGTLHADRDMLVQAMANLIQNALVHGGDETTLFAHGRALGVADNGPGVDPAKYAEIIKPMVRLDAARATDGSGLGLALVRAVADRHGASLQLSPNTPQGLRVTLDFPGS